MSNGFQFPFNSPPSSEFPEPPHTPNLVNSPEIPESPNPATLPVKTNPFTNLVADTQLSVETHIFQTAPTPQIVSSAIFNQPSQSQNPFDEILTLPELPPRLHTRTEVYSPVAFAQNDYRRCNPFLNEYELPSPMKPWVTGRRRSESRSTRSINSSATFHTAVPVSYSLPHRDSLSTSQGRSSLTKTSRSAKLSVYSLNQEIRLQEAAKYQDHKLRLERARDEVRRLDPSASTSRLHLPSVKSFNTRPKDYENPLPSLITNGSFWCIFLLAQTGLVSTGAAFAILFRDRKLGDGKIPVGVVFWIICSVAGLFIGLVGTGIMCARKGNACIGTQDKLGFNEIRDLSGNDLERGQAGGLLYLGVGGRDESSFLGGTNMRKDNNSLRFVRGREGRFGEWIVGDEDRRGSMDGTLKDPMWKDLYLTPCISRAQVGGSAGSQELRTITKSREGREADDSDLGAQRLTPTPLHNRASDDGCSSSTTRGRGEFAELGLSGQERDAETGRQIILHSTNTSMVSGASTLNDWNGNVSQEIHTWSPLDRLGRVLRGDTPIPHAEPKPQKRTEDEEGIELIDMNVPYEDLEDAKTKAEAGCKVANKEGKGVKWVGEHVAEYHGFWSPEIIQQRMKKRQEQREHERLKQLKEEKGKVEGINVRERAKHFESPAASAQDEGKKAQDNGIFVVDEDSEGSC